MKKGFCFATVLIGLILAHAAAYGSVRAVQDNHTVTYNVIDFNGDHVSGQTVALKIQKVSNGHWFDFNDSTFKASGWTSKSTNLSEDSTEGFYYYLFNPPASETTADQYRFCVDNASATYGDHQCEVVSYQEFSGSSAAAIADAVWDEAISGHLSAGTTGEKLNNASAAGNPWDTDISSGYAGKAGAYLRTLYRQRR